jgi:nitrogen regulatory protein PII 2
VKEVIAIIRPKKVAATRDVLEELGHPAITVASVLGRGKQRGIAGEVAFPLSSEMLTKGRIGGMKFIPKRYLSVVVENEEVASVVGAIVKVNQTAQVGDGKIFVCPLDQAVRVRTGETGPAAI